MHIPARVFIPNTIHSICEIVDTASYLPLYSVLALFPPRISVLESAQRQQPAHHEYKERQTSQRRLGQAQGTQAVQRQAGSERSATKLHFHAGQVKRIRRKREKKMRGTSGDLLERHSAACGGMRGGHIASPWRTKDPPYLSFSLFLLLNEELEENPQLDGL